MAPRTSDTRVAFQFEIDASCRVRPNESQIR
jgi:hypothetical protein